MNLFLVESPLQLLNALEARNYYDISEDQSTLIIFEGVSKKNFNQINEIAIDQEWANIYLIPNTKVSLGKAITNKLNEFIQTRNVNKILNKYANFEKVFIGEYRSIVMRHFVNKSNADECIMLDDGNYSMVIQNEILGGKRIKDSYSKSTRLFHDLLEIQSKDIKGISFFTIYENSQITSKYLNTYQYIKSNFKDARQTDSVYFLGNNTPELGILPIEEYLEGLKKVKEYYKGKEVIYIPHRRESPDKLNRIALELFKVHDFDLPIEWSIMKEKTLPLEIASFFSSALDNCYLIFGDNLKIRAFKFSPEIISQNRKDLFHKSFEKYEKYGDSFKIEKIY